MMQLLTAVVKKFPLIVPEKSERAQFPFCIPLKSGIMRVHRLQAHLEVAAKPCNSSLLAEDSHPFCASSTEQYYSWTIGKRRASEVAVSGWLCMFV